MTGPETFAKIKAAAAAAPAWMLITGIATATVVALWDRVGDRQDVILVLGAMGIVLGGVEWSLARRFKRHESWEAEERKATAKAHADVVAGMIKAHKEDYDRALMVREGYSAATEAFTRKVGEAMAEMRKATAELVATQQALKNHEERIRAMEERFTRAGFIPSAHAQRRTGNDEG